MGGQTGRRAEMVEGRRSEMVQWGLRFRHDSMSHRRGDVDERGSLEYAVASRERPFAGWHGDEQVVTRTIVTYTTQWTEVPGHEGSRHLSCDHPGTPQGRTGPPIMRDAPDGLRGPGPDYQPAHAFRERDMAAGPDGGRRYTCPVCGLTWRHRDDAAPADPQQVLF